MTIHTTPLELVLSRKELEVFSHVRDAGVIGIVAERLEAKLYDHMLEPPLTARNCVHVHIHNANRKLALFGLKIVAVNRRYLIKRLELAPSKRQRCSRCHRMWAF